MTSNQFEKPRWLRDLVRFLPLKSQFVLSGIAFFSHQVGSFTGGYWAGWLFDEVGNYDAVWWVSIALGVFAGIVHLPIRERRPALAAP